MADVKTFLDAAEKKMNEAVAYLDETLSRVRAGKANPKILDPVKVEYYPSEGGVLWLDDAHCQRGKRGSARCTQHHYHPLGETHD